MSFVSDIFHIKQWSPTFLAPGTGFMEDNFCTDEVGGGGGMILEWFKHITFIVHFIVITL